MSYIGIICNFFVYPYRGKGQVYVASTSHVWCLHAIPVNQQIPQLLSEKQFGLALKLVVSNYIRSVKLNVSETVTNKFGVSKFVAWGEL